MRTEWNDGGGQLSQFLPPREHGVAVPQERMVDAEVFRGPRQGQVRQDACGFHLEAELGKDS